MQHHEQKHKKVSLLINLLESLVDDDAGERQPRDNEHAPDDLLAPVGVVHKVAEAVDGGVLAVAQGMRLDQIGLGWRRGLFFFRIFIHPRGLGP